MAGSGAREHREQLVPHALELALFEAGRAPLVERVELVGRIGLQIHLRSLKACVPSAVSDLVETMCMSGTAAIRVWASAPLEYSTGKLPGTLASVSLRARPPPCKTADGTAFWSAIDSSCPSFAIRQAASASSGERNAAADQSPAPARSAGHSETSPQPSGSKPVAQFERCW